MAVKGGAKVRRARGRRAEILLTLDVVRALGERRTWGARARRIVAWSGGDG